MILNTSKVMCMRSWTWNMDKICTGSDYADELLKFLVIATEKCLCWKRRHLKYSEALNVIVSGTLY